MARTIRMVLLTLILLAPAITAEAVDMTGTWTGRERCACFNSALGESTDRYKDSVMEVTQDGTDLNIQAYGERFNGNVMDHPRSRSRGEASLMACSTDPKDNASFGEIGRAKVWAKDGGRGKIAIESLWTSHESEICTCKGKFRRTDSADPEIGDCSDSDSDPDEVDKWHVDMLHAPPTTLGCHELEHPETEWRKVECDQGSTAKHARSASERGDRVKSARTPGSPFYGPWEVDGSWVVQAAAPGAHLWMVMGGFKNVTGVTEIVDTTNPAYPGHGQGAGFWTLQLNTNEFTGALACKGRPGCKGWQQFVYVNRAPENPNKGLLIIEYWLLNYGAKKDSDCPLLPPGGFQDLGGLDLWVKQRWSRYGEDCVMDTVHYDIARPATHFDLEDISLTAGLTGPPVGRGDWDMAYIRIGKRLHAHIKERPELLRRDKVLGLARPSASHWTDAEFNIFGLAGGTTAVFNSGSSMDTELTILLPVNLPTGMFQCSRGGGTTGETNNLVFGDPVRGTGPTCRSVRSGFHQTFTFHQFAP